MCLVVLEMPQALHAVLWRLTRKNAGNAAVWEPDARRSNAKVRRWTYHGPYRRRPVLDACTRIVHDAAGTSLRRSGSLGGESS